MENENDETTFLIQNHKENNIQKPNPFIHKLDLNSNYDRFKLLFMSVFILPFRVCGIIICLLVAYGFTIIGLTGVSKEELTTKPLQGWRKIAKDQVRLWVRYLHIFFGFHYVEVKGIQASSKDAPILAVAPHSSFFDALPVVVMGAPSIIAKAEVQQVPFFAKYINYTQPVYVRREDNNSRQNTIQEIVRRAKCKLDWPQIMIFPEGTCTNRSCLITFKGGAFYPGVPVQPVVLRYPNRSDCITWTWDGPGVCKMLWVTLCQFHNYCELEYLPVYHPSPEEKNDSQLFAANVRQVMADALGVPCVDYTYDDCRLMHKAKLKRLPCNTGLIEFQKLRKRLGLDLKNVEDELLAQYADMAVSDGKISLKDFAKHLEIPSTEPALIELFNSYDKSGSGTIDFREFLIGYCLYVKPANTETTLRWAFTLFDRGSKGHITCEDLIKALGMSLDLTIEEATRIFKQADVERKGYITYDDFVRHAKRKPEYAKIFLTYQKSIKEGTRTRGYTSNKSKTE